MKQLWTLMGIIPLLMITNTSLAGDSGSAIKVMNLEQAVSYALENNPGMNAERKKLGIGKGKTAQADLLVQYNPKVSVNYFDRITPDNDQYNDFQFSLSQQFEVAGQPGLRREAARLNLKKIEWRIKNAQRLLKAEVKRTFYMLMIMKEKTNLARQVVNFRREMLDISQKRHEAGDISKLQVDISQVGLIRSQKEQLDIKREYNRYFYRLKQIINWDLSKGLEIEGKAEATSLKIDKEKALTFTLANRPDLSAARYNLKQAEKQAQLAYTKRIPDITFSTFYQRDEDADLFGAGISIPIPTFNRNQGEILQSSSQKNVLHHQLAWLRTEVTREILTASENFTLAVAEVAIFKKEILPRLSATLELVKESFRLGQVDQMTVTVSQNEFIQTRFSYLEALREYYLALVELEKAADAEISVLISIE